jgi:hypothetical protein
MPQEIRQEMKNMRNDVEKVPDDEKSQDYSNSQNNQLEKLVKCNTYLMCNTIGARQEPGRRDQAADGPKPSSRKHKQCVPGFCG